MDDPSLEITYLFVPLILVVYFVCDPDVQVPSIKGEEKILKQKGRWDFLHHIFSC